MIGRYRVENEIEAPGILLEHALVFGGEEIVGSKLDRVGAFAGRIAEYGDVRADGVAELDPHMA
jgi:hypothetical protein